MKLCWRNSKYIFQLQQLNQENKMKVTSNYKLLSNASSHKDVNSKLYSSASSNCPCTMGISTIFALDDEGTWSWLGLYVSPSCQKRGTSQPRFLVITSRSSSSGRKHITTVMVLSNSYNSGIKWIILMWPKIVQQQYNSQKYSL